MVRSLFAFLFIVSGMVQAEFNADQLKDKRINVCEVWQPADWDKFKEYVLNYYPDEYMMQDGLKQFRDAFKKCATQINSAGLTACTERMDYLGKIAIDAPRSNIHAWKTNKEYFNSIRPEFKNPPIPFLGGLPENWIDVVNSNGWKCVTFKSKLPTYKPDVGEALYRTIILRPMTVDGKRVMQRLLITSFDPNPVQSPYTFQTITTEHEYDGRIDNGFDKGARINFYAAERGKYSVHGGMRMIDSSFNGGCIGCHFTGPIRVKPDDSFKPKFCGNYDLEAFNNDLLSDSTTPNQENLLDPKLHPRPTLGKFPISKDGKVGVDGAGSTSCSTCHNDVGGVRNPLIAAVDIGNPISDLPDWEYEIEIHQNMPPGRTWTQAEWDKAKLLLGEEHRAGIRNWVTALKCEKPPSPKPVDFEVTW